MHRTVAKRFGPSCTVSTFCYNVVIIHYYRAMLAQSAVMRLHVVCLSVCLSVCL